MRDLLESQWPGLVLTEDHFLACQYFAMQIDADQHFSPEKIPVLWLVVWHV